MARPVLAPASARHGLSRTIDEMLNPPAPNPLSPADLSGVSLPRLADFRRGDKSSLISHVVVRGFVRLVDFTLIALAGFAAAALYPGQGAIAAKPLYVPAIGLTALLTMAIFEVLDLYSSRSFPSLFKQAPRLLLGWASAFGVLASAVFFMKAGHELSRVWLVLWFAAGAPTLALHRLVLSRLVRHWARTGQLYRRAVIYGSGPITEDLIRQLECGAATDIRITGIFDERMDERSRPCIQGYPRVGNIDDLLALGRELRIDLVIVALPISAEDRLKRVAGRVSILPADIKLPARATQIHFAPRVYSHVGSVAMIDLYDKPISDWGVVAKWLFDKAIGVLALLMLAPLMAAIAVLIKLDSPGPVLFRQKRYGFNNELIEIFKFRSMYVADCDADAATLVTKDDPRVTRVGRVLRRSSLDELPQLLNVLSGELSLVGPRPHALAAKAANRRYDEVVDGYFVRHKVKPGITGWAQIHGWRGETDTPEKIQKRVEHDLYYIDNWSLLLDIYILLATPLSLLRSKNAY
jgi:Undecaprenyl-phosphate glucose phosphotransferase